jgi:hypothetical protein
MTAPTLKQAEIKRRRNIIRTGLTKFLQHPKGYALREIFHDKQHHGTPFYCTRAIKHLIGRSILRYHKTRYWLTSPDEALELRMVVDSDDEVDALFLESEKQLELPMGSDEAAVEDEAPDGEHLRILMNGEPVEDLPPATVPPAIEAESGEDLQAFAYLYRLIEGIYAGLDEGRAPAAIRSLVTDVSKKVESVELKVAALTGRVERLIADQEATSKLYMESASALQEISVLFRLFAEQDDFFTQIKESHAVLMFMKNRMLTVSPPRSEQHQNGTV